MKITVLRKGKRMIPEQYEWQVSKYKVAGDNYPTLKIRKIRKIS
jgi:hypothetical protein